MSYQQLDRIESMVRQLVGNGPSQSTAHNMLELFRCMREKRTIEAIKLYRQMTGSTLKQSKDEIDSIMDRMRHD